MSEDLLKEKHLTPFANSLYSLIYNFLLGMKVNDFHADQFARFVSHLFEFDNAHRYPLQDIMSESKQEYWKNPRKELKRLTKIFLERHTNVSVKKKARSLHILLSLALMLPKAKKSLIKAFEAIDIKDLQFDEWDEYWTCIRTDYMYLGMTPEEREEYANQAGWVLPQQYL